MNYTRRCLGFGIDWSGSLSAMVTYDYMPIPVAPALALFSLGWAGLVSKNNQWGRVYLTGDNLGAKEG
ncbi:MAG: hypothetical protein ACI9JM_000108 [Halioglobus sp.]|jgi:hypothetical protein